MKNRKKICVNCRYIFSMIESHKKCPNCNSIKTHFLVGSQYV